MLGALTRDVSISSQRSSPPVPPTQRRLQRRRWELAKRGETGTCHERERRARAIEVQEGRGGRGEGGSRERGARHLNTRSGKKKPKSEEARPSFFLAAWGMWERGALVYRHSAMPSAVLHARHAPPLPYSFPAAVVLCASRNSQHSRSISPWKHRPLSVITTIEEPRHGKGKEDTSSWRHHATMGTSHQQGRPTQRRATGVQPLIHFADNAHQAVQPGTMTLSDSPVSANKSTTLSTDKQASTRPTEEEKTKEQAR